MTIGIVYVSHFLDRKPGMISSSPISPPEKKAKIIMKNRNDLYRHSSHYCPAYPNEADTSYYRKKLLDIIGGLAAGMMLTLWMVILIRIS